MKAIADMSVEELAGLVCQTLKQAGIAVTLTGGSCVTIWSRNKYVSDDLDFIEEGPVSRRDVAKALKTLGFQAGQGRHFVHPQTSLFVEFPTGPLMVGKERVELASERNTGVGKLRLLSPTDCVKDRLAAYFHWNDRQALEQAVLVAEAQKIDLDEIRRWSRAEGGEDKFRLFKERLQTRQPTRRKAPTPKQRKRK